MRRIFIGAGVLLMLGVLAVAPGRAFVTRPLPLATLLASANQVCTAKVDRFDPDRPAVVLTVDGDLKGKLPLRRLPLNLEGDSDGKKYKHTPQLLKRLAKDLPLILFLIEKTDGYSAFGYTNGTWFQFTGRKDADRVRWAFTHCEPYLKRTYQGTTAELRQVIVEALAGKKPAPDVDLKVEPGLGPEVKPKNDKSGARDGRGPLFAVIPTVGIGAPLAVLAMLFPTVFGGLIILFRRWLGMLTVVGTDSTLFVLYAWQRPNIGGYWWGTAGALWTAITAVTLLGAVWVWRRHLLQPPEEVPARTELWTLIVCSVAGLGGVLWYVLTLTPSLTDTGWKVLLLISAGFWAGTLYTVAVRLTAARRPTGRALPTEGVILWTMAAACAFLTTGGATGKVTGAVDLGAPEAAVPQRGARLLRQVWKFQPVGESDVSSSPVVAGKQVFIAVIGGNVIEKTGTLYCLDRDRGTEVWRFNDDGRMRPPHSTPCVADGRVYIGEGFHENAGCRLFCVDGATGKKVWAFETNSHTESSPSVVAGKVFFGAGDDGLYCLDAVSGKKLWQYPDPQSREGLHVDASPTVIGKRLYCGSGQSRTHKKLQVFCLDTDTGKPVWVRDDIEVPAWSKPAVADGCVYFGLGNGRLTIGDPKKPRGAVLCVQAADGRPRWLFEGVKDAVHTHPAVDHHHVYVGSRDGRAYCLDRRSGSLIWKQNVDSPLVAGLVLARCSCCDATASVYVAATGGVVRCLDPDSGAEFWKHSELAEHSPSLLSSPVVEVRQTKDGDRRRLYFASGTKGNAVAVVYCLEDQWRAAPP